MISRKFLDSLHSTDPNRLSTMRGYYEILNFLNLGYELGNCLEVGCGSIYSPSFNLFSTHPQEDILWRCKTYTGIDISLEAAKNAKLNSYRVLQASGSNLPFKNLSFNTSIAVETLSQCGSEATKVVKELGRVTLNEIYILTTHRDAGIKYKGKGRVFQDNDELTIIAHSDPEIGSFSYFTEESLINLLNKQGFRILEQIIFKNDNTQEKIFIAASRI